MKSWLLVAVVCVLVAVGSAFAKDPAKESDALKASGKVTAWNADKMSVSIQDKEGATHTFSWTAETKISGDPAVGKTVRVRYEQKDGGAVHVLSIRGLAEEQNGKRAAAKKQTEG